MYRSSGEQVFARVQRIRQRALQLTQTGDGPIPPAPPDDDLEREGMAMAAQVELRLPMLLKTFGLGPLAGDVLVCLIAAEFDPFMRTLTRAVQRELGKPWLEIGTIAELLELPPERVPQLGALFAAESPLRRYALVTVDESVDAPIVSVRVKISTRVAQHVVGDDRLPEGLRRITPRATLGDSLVPREAGQALVRRVRRALAEREPLVVEITGVPGTGRRYLAEGVAHELGMPLVVVDLAGLARTERGDGLRERLAEGRREALLCRALLCLADWDTQLPQAIAGEDPTGQPLPAAPRSLPTPYVRLFERLEGVVLVTSEEREPLVERHAPVVVHIDVPFPTPSQRAVLLEKAIARADGTIGGDVDLVAVARRFALDPARIQVAARAAVELARERPGTPEGHGPDDGAAGGPPRPVGRTHVADACRRQLRHDLKSLAVRVTASHKWEDLVIPVDVYEGLREMISYVRHATLVYDVWGFGARHSLAMGVSALFAGPPGTGKTMCASVMARELDMELFRVDLSRVVSKWIGETEKNLGKVFDEAQRSNAIILFDEADSLFAKRTDVKSSVDRYANLEVNYLLQRMESFSGVTILTSNFEDSIDAAFKRRLSFRLRFEKPDAEARAALWQKMFPPGCALAADVNSDRLGELYEMSGGNIRNAAVRAAFLAAAEGRPIDMKMCMTAAERESREMGLLTRAAPAVRRDPNRSAAGIEAHEQPQGTPKLRPIGRPPRRD